MKGCVTPLIVLVGVTGCLLHNLIAIGQDRAITGESKAEIFAMLSAQMEANYQEIGTWSGTYDLSERLYTANRRTTAGTDTGPVWQVSEVVVPFTIDTKADRVRADFVKAEPAKIVDRGTGEPLPVVLASREYRTIGTSEHLIDFAVRDLRNQVRDFPKIDGFDRTRTRVVYRKDSRLTRKDQFHVNPIAFFGDGNRRFSETCSLYAGWLRDESDEKTMKHVENDTTIEQRQMDGVTEYVVTIGRPSEDGREAPHVRTMVFSSAVRFNPTIYKMISYGRPEVEMSWEYRQEDGICLPSRYETKRFEWANPRENEPQDEDSNLVSHRIFTLRESILNQPVDPAVFELASLGLEYGDRLADEIERKLQVFDGEKLVAAEEFELDTSRLPDRSKKRGAVPQVEREVGQEAQRRSSLPVIVAGVLLLAVVIVILVQRRG